MSSILNDVKHQIGLVEDDSAFDTTVIIHINTVLTTLGQLGVGPAEGFMITDATQEWDQFFDDQRLNTVKSYIGLRVRLLFDPPATGFTAAAFERQVSEMEFRILSETDY